MSLRSLSLEQEAVHESTPCDRLIELSKISTLLAQLVAKNSSAPSKLLRELSNSNDVITRQIVAANPNTPTDVLLNLGGEFPEQLLNNAIFSLLWLENPNLLNEMPRTTLLSILKHESVPVSFLEWAVNQLEAEVQLAVAMNAQASKTLLEQLVRSQYIQEQEAARLHINIAGEMTSGWHEAAIETFQATNFPAQDEYIKVLARKGLIPEFVIKLLAKHKYKSIRALLAQIPDPPVHLLEPLAQDKDEDVHGNVAFNPTETSAHVLEQLVQTGNNLPLGIIAFSPNIPIRLLEQLAQDKNKDVRWNVAFNPKTPAHVLEQLAQDKDNEVRRNVAKHRNTPVILSLELILKDHTQGSVPSLSRFIVLLHTQPPAKDLAENCYSLEWLERYAIAQNANTPTDTLKALALDANRIVRAAAKANLQGIVPATAKANLPSRNPTRADAEQLCQQAERQEQSGQLLAAIQYWEQALTIYREIGDRKGQADTWRELGLAFRSLV